MTQHITADLFYTILGIQDILIPTMIVGGITLFLGVIIAIVSKVFQLPVNQLQSDLQAVLPGANCGACGFSGCEGYAVYLAGGGKDIGKCPVGGPDCSNELASLMGLPPKPFMPQVAHVMCNGTAHHTTKRFDYKGILDCNAAQGLFSGPNSCTFGCMGYGSCVEKCPYEAIDMVDGIAVINKVKCTACGLCVPVCPKKLIFIVPKFHNDYTVECRNKWPGSETKKHCTAGCIGCQRCFKICPSGAITMDGPLAVIDPVKCTQCGKCYEVCPVPCISRADAPFSSSPDAG